MSIDAQGAASIQAVLDAQVENVPGVVFGIANREKILFKGAAGIREVGKSQKMTTDTVSWIASCTKAITGIACMQLVEQGKVQLDDPVDAILPEVAAAQILVNADTLETKPAATKITLRMLLNHTSGYSYTFFSEGVKKWAENLGEDEFGGNLAAFDQPLICEPGTQFNYSVGIDWAGILVERVSGLKLGAYFKKFIFDPLGADDIAFDLSDSMRARLAGMHARSPEGKLSARKHFPIAYKENAFHSGGGGSFASVESYLKVIQILINQGKGANGAQILKPETVKEMLTDQVAHKLPAELERPIKSQIPELSNDLPNMHPGTTKGWGLTFLKINEAQPTGRGAGSVWWAGLANCYWWADNVNGVVGMIQTQILPFADPHVFGAWAGAEAAAYKAMGIAPQV